MEHAISPSGADGGDQRPAPVGAQEARRRRRIGQGDSLVNDRDGHWGAQGRAGLLARRGDLPAAPRAAGGLRRAQRQRGARPGTPSRRWWTPAACRACGCSTSTPTRTTTAASSPLAGEPLAVQDALVDAGRRVRRPDRPAPPPRRPPAHRSARRGADRGPRPTTTCRWPPRSAAGLAERIGDRAQPARVPATARSRPTPSARRPRDFRRGGLEELERADRRGRAWCPTPARTALHPTAGAVLVGVRAAR